MEGQMSIYKPNKDLVFIWNDLMNDKARLLALRSLVFVLLGSLLLIAVPYGISFYIDGLTNKLLDTMLVGGMIFFSLQLFEIGVSFARQRVRERFFQEEFWYLPYAITALSFARPLSFLTSQSSDINGGGIESLRDRVWNVISTYIFVIIPIYGLSTFGLAACFFAHPIIGSVALLYAGTELTLGRINNQFIQREMRPVIDLFKRWERRMSEWWHNIDHIKYQGVETKILNMIRDEAQEPLAGDDKVWRIYYANWIAIRQAVSLLFACAVYGITGYLVYTQVVSGASGVLIFFSLQRVRNTLRELSDQQREVQFNLANIAKYRRTLKQPVPFMYHTGADFTGDSIAVTFDNVLHAVTDEGKEKMVLKDVSLVIPAGMKVGVVGPSGAGKSQLVSLLVRATDPVSGRLLINNQDLRSFRLESLLRYYGVIMQKSEPYEGTLLRNLLFGVSHLDMPKPYQDLGDDAQATLLTQANLALKKAGLNPNDFPKGIMTIVGYKGLKLSGGQQQRLQIAGAHLKLAMSEHRPRLILADEPTASLDSLSELTVMQHLQEELPDGTTMLMVAHRLSTVATMDKIVFVRPLTVCDNDTPQVTMHDSLAELYQAEPLFREMANAQQFLPEGIVQAA
jgi:ABC-type multidrug transport system fused ATPase/permease subunit